MLATPARETPGDPRRAPLARPARAGPSLLLIGRAADTAILRDLLEEHFLVALRRREDAFAAVDDVDAETLAVILTLPQPSRSSARVVGYLRGMLQVGARPVVAVAFEELPRRREAALYRRGASAVFEWPDDRDALVQFCLQLPNIAIKLPTRQEDAATARRVRDRVRAAAELDPRRLKVQVRAGTVYLQGGVDALWKRRLIERVASEVDGVRHVVSRALEVEPHPTTDRAIARSVEALLAATSDIDETTLGLDVQDGVLTLAGTVDHREELKRLEELLSHVKGVREIENLSTVSPTTREQDAARARQLRRRLAAIAGPDDVLVSVFGTTAVARGEVASLERKDSLRRWLQRRRGVERVVDRLRIAAPAPGGTA